MALSYTWGSRVLEDDFVVDGKSVAITKNLGEALRKLHTYLRKETLMLWVDLISINQRDLQERSHQVGLMNAIYRCAERVGIWLGEAHGNSDLVLYENDIEARGHLGGLSARAEDLGLAWNPAL